MTPPGLSLRHILPGCSDETKLWSFVVCSCKPMSLTLRDSLMDVHVDDGVCYAGIWKVQDKSHFK